VVVIFVDAIWDVTIDHLARVLHAVRSAFNARIFLYVPERNQIANSYKIFACYPPVCSSFT
jgi:hypothetical protein